MIVATHKRGICPTHGQRVAFLCDRGVVFGIVRQVGVQNPSEPDDIGDLVETPSGVLLVIPRGGLVNAPLAAIYPAFGSA
jgi:hypothetical protein